MDPHLSEYRRDLVTAEKKAQDDYDKTIVLLSGGALGISFAFVKDIAGDPPYACARLLFWSWMVWGASVAAVLASHFTSNRAFRRAIDQVDKEADLYTVPVGGRPATATSLLNAVGGILFLAGVVLISIFVWFNL